MKIWKKLIICCLSFISIGCLEKDDDYDALKLQFQALLDRSIADTGTAGAVLLVQTPYARWNVSSGFADLKSLTPMGHMDMLRLASMTKTFVSVVLLKLSEERTLSLDDKMQQYLPETIVERIPYGSEITVRQLLSMTSGIYGYTESDDYGDAIDDSPHRSPWTPEELLEYVYLEKAVFPPGTGWDYSNTNYILFDIIVKAVTGNSLAQEMRRIIHAPLALKNTFMEIQEPRAGGFGGLIVRGYNGDGEDITEIQDGFGLGDGGLISDAQGVAEFLQALFVDQTLLNTASLNQMCDFHPEEDYGLGLERRMTSFGKAWAHSGGSCGFEGDMLYLPKTGVIFVILTNGEVDADTSGMVFQGSMELLQDCPPKKSK